MEIKFLFDRFSSPGFTFLYEDKWEKVLNFDEAIINDDTSGCLNIKLQIIFRGGMKVLFLIKLLNNLIKNVFEFLFFEQF